ncbi:ABC transporter permease [Deinococcus peraridilitoris]|uniref:ABC-type dipeptide/oligopeptide/nickel transport system, permease component n=1 Tax=Deinococcus peraridilitoris (strain DSM 19664 / LMG 22246 / CIP 109416 / KR-200) TaxID=937777 RepID=L0A6G4_DEIPD|nr:ABC transporter permease [Deinococcus peraridilitoris]AFZ69441.1 ABC-type dipeptide/oligopeptide/nickel transport system, permease component [Deinococcus peraridilitoris DSM 19664]
MPFPYLLKRLLHAAVVLVVVCVIAFFLIRLAPGGPSLLADPNLGSVERQAIEERLGLNDPLPVQFAKWTAQLAQGELGQSFLYGTPVTQIILSRLPNTLLLAGMSLLITILIAIPLGMLCGLRPNSWLDRVISTISVVFIAVPVFWLGLLLIILFAVTLHVLPAGGMYTTGREGNLPDLARHLILPVLVLSSASIAEVLRYTRSSTRSVSRQDYVRTARAKGLNEFSVHSRHTLKNALIPVLTVLGLQLPRLIGGAAVTETIFSWPGMGRLSVEAALGRDYPLMTAITIFVALAVVMFNLLIDMLYPLIDPRIKAEA